MLEPDQPYPKRSLCPYCEPHSSIALNPIPNHKPTLALTANAIPDIQRNLKLYS